MSNENEAPEGVAVEAAPRKRTMKDIKASTAAKAGKKPAGKAATKAAEAAQPDDEDDVPLELKARPMSQEAPEGFRWLAYLGPEESKLCYRASAPLLFAPQAWSKGHPVALVGEAFGLWLIENCALKNYSDGSARKPEDYADAYAWYDEVSAQRRKLHAARRHGAVV